MTSRDDGASLPFARPRGARDETARAPSAAAARLLPALKAALADLPRDKKPELAHVQRVAPSLVDDEHLLLFLRGEELDVERALQKLVEHWRHRRKVFGEAKYALPMTLTGAMKNNINLMKQGFLTILLPCDGAGRPILYLNRSVVNYSNATADQKLQTLWYLLHVLMHDSDTLEHGYTRLVNHKGTSPDGYDPTWAYQATLMLYAFPIRSSKGHLCYNNAAVPLAGQMVNAVHTALAKAPDGNEDVVIKHNGSEERVMQSLAEQGIPNHCVPIEMGGTLLVSTEVFLRNRLSIEGGGLESNESIARILSPNYSENHGSDPTLAEEEDMLHSSNTGSETSLMATRHETPLLENSPINAEAMMAAAVNGCALVPQQDENLCEMAQLEISPEVKAAVEVASLRALREKLSGLPREEKSEFVQVQQIAPDLVDNHHLLLFLRAANFDVNRALQNLLDHWRQRHKVFGAEHYALPMTLDGAMKEHVEALKQGYFLTILPSCDKLGRPVLYIDDVHRSSLPEYNATKDERHRVLWYLLHVLMLNRDAQRKGFVTLTNSRGLGVKDWDSTWSSQASLIGRAFPVKCKVPHLVHDALVFRLLATAVKAVLTLSQRESFVVHSGSNQRVLQSLAEYGLPKHSIPIALGGTLHPSGDAFVRERSVIERGVIKSPVSRYVSDSGPKSETEEDMVGSLGSSSGASETWAVSKTTKHFQHVQSNEAKELVAFHESFPKCTENIHQEISSEAENTVASSCYLLKENNKIGILPDPHKTLSAGSPYLPVQPMPPLTIGKRDATVHLPEEENTLKRKSHTDGGNKNKKCDNLSTKAVRGNRKTPGASGDPRMNLAVQLKLENPSLSLVAALLKGGFVFNNFTGLSGQSISDVRDTDDITLYQRRNQLMRRLRKEREKASKR